MSKVASDAHDKLSPVLSAALEFLIQAARDGRQLTKADLTEAVGSANRYGGTASDILNRLADKGYIKRSYFQKGVQVCIVSTGECTAAPANSAPHWRQIAEASDTITPTMAIHQVAHEVPNVAQYIHRMMRDQNMSYTAASIELLSRGISHRESGNV